MSRLVFQQLMADPSVRMNTALEEIGQACIQLEKLAEISDAVVQVEHASQESRALVVSSLGLAVEGMDAPELESLVQGLESLETPTFSERVRKILAWIRARFNALVDRIRGLFSFLKDDVTYIKGRLYVLRERHTQRSGQFPKGDSIDLSGIVHTVTVREGMPSNATQILRDANHLRIQLKQIQELYVPVVKTTGRRLVEAMGSSHYREGRLNDWLEGLNSAAQGMEFSRLAKMLPNLSRVNDPRFAEGTALMAPPVLGDRAIFIVNGQRGEQASTEVQYANHLQNTGMHLIRPRPNSRYVHDDTPSMDTMSHSAIGDMLNTVEMLVKSVESSQSETFRTELDSVRRELQRLETQLPEKDSGSEIIKAASRYSAALGRWIRDPYLTLSAHALSACRALLNVSARAINTL